jgi:EmrB/QacA subfamily drug resistance transporter
VKAAPASVWALAAAVVGSGMSFIDGTAVNVALPILQHDLGASAESVAWVVEGYTLFLSALMLIGGSLGDRFGRRRMYAIGIALFALASAACGLAATVDALIVARCVQGIGGALATPGSLALIAASYEGAARGRAIGTWSGASAVLSALGPVLGGTLVQAGSWRYVFLINVPLAAVVLAVLAFRVRESRDSSAVGGIDVTGAVLVTFGLGSLVYGLIRLQRVSDAPGIAAVVAGTGALAAFVAIERRSAHPMVSLALFRSRTFTVANLYTFLLYATLGGGLYFIPFDLIDARGYAPAFAGAALLPFVAIVFPLSRFSGGLVARIGPRIPLAAGAALVGAAFVVFALAPRDAPYWTSFFPGAVLLGFGGAAFVAPLTTTVMSAIESSHAGMASGINNAVSRTAGLVAIACLGIAFAHTLGARLGSDGGTAYAAAFRTTMLCCAIVAACAAVVALAGFVENAPRPLSIVDPRRDR